MIVFFPLLAHRLNDLIYFFPLFFLCWGSMALLTFLFSLSPIIIFTISPFTTINIIIFIFIFIFSPSVGATRWRLTFAIINNIFSSLQSTPFSSSTSSSLLLLPPLDLHSLFSPSHHSLHIFIIILLLLPHLLQHPYYYLLIINNNNNTIPTFLFFFPFIPSTFIFFLLQHNSATIEVLRG